MPGRQMVTVSLDLDYSGIPAFRAAARRIYGVFPGAARRIYGVEATPSDSCSLGEQ